MTDTIQQLISNNAGRPNSEIILSFETAIQGGSIAIVRDGILLDSWVGNKSISTSENILDEISRLLAKNKIDKRLIGKLIYPIGPGSFTGIRIGCAIAKGLAKSIKCEYIGASVLESLLVRNDENYPVLSAAPVGNRQVVWEIFKKGINCKDINCLAEANFSVSDEDIFFTGIMKEFSGKIILYEYLYKKVLEINLPIFFENKKIINAGKNPAVLLAGKFIDCGDNK